VKRLLLILLLAFGAAAQPRPLNDAERQAVSAVAAFLDAGPGALHARLAPDAPLRLLAEADALRELHARMGPRAGAKWTLQTVQGSAHEAAFRVTFPSGYEDGLLFRMKNGAVHELLTLAEVTNVSRPLPPDTAPLRRQPLLIAAIFLALIAAFFRRTRVLFALAAIGALGVALYEPAKTASLPFVELGELIPLREALARGDEPPAHATHEVAQLWILQSGAPGLLPKSASSQLAELVRARIAIAADDKEEARRAFDRALAMKPQRDDLVLEAAASLEGYTFTGSRDAAFHYERAMKAADAEEAQRELRIAWKLKPRPREELVREPRLFPLLHDVRALSMVSLLGAQEPLQRPTAPGSMPIPFPPTAKTFVCGEFLRIEIGNSILDVPGGAPLAPKSAPVVPATYWSRQEDAAALRDAESLLELPARATTPAARTRVLHAVEALANHNRWRDLVTLTNDITPRTETVPPELLVLRLRALLRAGRTDEARALAEGDAVKALMRRTSYPATLISVADAMANIGQHETASQLYQAVRSKEHETLVAARLRQLELRRALATTGTTIRTANFDIRHAQTMNPAIAARIGELLEAELARLQQKLPASDPRRVTVNVLSWEDFRGNITGSDHILGLYDGEILFPFAVVQQFKPEVVAIITHELTHALVAQATGDNAPRWFQEGLAQRMELVPHQENAFYGRAPELVLPVPLIDAVMENAIDPFTIEHGYTVAQTFIRFLESRYGPTAIATLIAEFAKGRNTDDALTTLTGKSADELNRDFRSWGFANNGNFTSTEPWPYTNLYSPGVDPRIREGFTWGKRD
jgi:tetratricopeptide (TPR) repeat protein